MKLILMFVLLGIVPAAHADYSDKLQQCYRVESSSFDCDDLTDDQLENVIETQGLDDGDY